jgi:hypothetical protein
VRRDEGVVDFVERADELLAVAAGPLLAADCRPISRRVKDISLRIGLP